jgi:hypothetical protein
MCPTIKKKFGTQNKQLKFYKIMVVLCLMFGGETWTLRRTDERKSEGAEAMFLKYICSR